LITVAATEVANKLRILSVLFSQPGDLVLSDNEKAGLVGLFDDLVIELTVDILE
jgi:hypothetical protein